MTHRIVFRPQARDDLLSLHRYIAERAGLSVAAGYIGRIEAACMGLADFPERGTRRDDLLAGLRTIGFERRATIAFRVMESPVEILAIAYGGRLFEDDVGEGG